VVIFTVIRSTSSNNGIGFSTTQGVATSFVEVGASFAVGNDQLAAGTVSSYGDSYTDDMAFPFALTKQ